MEPLRVMTFNVRVDLVEDGTDAWSQRRDLAASTIRYHAPDVLGLQEPLAGQLADLRERLEGYRWLGQSRRRGEREGEFVPVAVRSDRFSVVDRGTFWLSETPEEPGSTAWDAAHPRVATWARLADATGDRSLVVCNTHLDHEGERARREGADLVADRVADRAGDALAVVTGDLNCVAGDPPHERFDGARLADGRRLVDAAAVADHRHGPATTRTDFHDLLPGRWIDHVFVSEDCRVASVAAVTDRDDDRYPSDHLPVVADLVP